MAAAIAGLAKPQVSLAEHGETQLVRQTMEQRAGLSEAQFIRRVLIVIALVALALLLWLLRDVLLLVFGAVVTSTLFLSLADQFKRLRLSPGLALTMSVLTIFAIVGGAMALFGAQLADQTESLSQALPKAWQSLQVRLQSWGVPIDLSQMQLSGLSHNIAASAGQFVMSLGTGLANLLLIIVGGIFIAASPRFYTIGAVKLVPDAKRRLMGEALGDSGKALRLWLKAIPAILIAVAIDPQLGLWTALLYLGIQQVEGYAVQPLLQSWAVEIPGAVLLFALLACGGLFGALGIIFAAPLTVVAYVLIKRLYVREALDTPTPIPGEDQPEPSPAS
jgi:predicted PurR-regulated permease PerM